MKLPEAPALRPLNRDDESERNLVIAGWLRTYTDASRGVERSVFFRLYEPLVKALVERCDVACAVLADEPGVIMGWMATEGSVLHYVCSKPRWQRLGIATWLLGHADKVTTYTHTTRAGMKLAVPPAWQYTPMRRFQEAA